MQVAETSKSKKRPKVLDHLRIHRSLDGGHVIEHHYTSFEHEPRSYKFGPGEGGRAEAHMARHAGFPSGPGEAAEKSEDMSDERAEGAEGEEP